MFSLIIFLTFLPVMVEKYTTLINITPFRMIDFPSCLFFPHPQIVKFNTPNIKIMFYLMSLIRFLGDFDGGLYFFSKFKKKPLSTQPLFVQLYYPDH